MHDRLRHLILRGWAEQVSRHPKIIIWVAVLLAVASVAGTVHQLEFQSDRNALISTDLPWNQRFIDWVDHFDAANELVVVVDTEGTASGAEDAKRMVDALGPVLAADQQVQRALWGFDPAALHPRALRIAPMDVFETQLAEIEQSGLLLQSPTPSALLTRIAMEMRDQAGGEVDEDEAVAQLGRLHNIIKAYAAGITTPVDQPLEFEKLFMGEAAIPLWQYLESDNGRLLFITIVPKRYPELLNPLEPAITSIRRIVADAAKESPQVSVGLTGIEVIESDETDTATRDSAFCSAVALVLIALLLVTAFHSFRIPLILLASLGVGLSWSFGFLTLTIGHLQVLSVVFTVILMGLGVDYGIHLITGYELARHKHPDGRAGFAGAMRESFETAGPGIITGALSSAAAFLTTLFTDFTGVAEMGLIAGAGVLLCLVAMLTVFPALVRKYKSKHKHIVEMEDRLIHLYSDRWVMPFVRHPRTTLVVTALVFAGSSYIAMTRIHFDFDLMKLMPVGVPSVETARLVTDEGGTSIWFGVSKVDSLDEARALAARYRAKPHVAGKFGGVGMLIPDDEPRKLERLRQVRAKLPPRVDEAPAGDVIVQLSGLRLALTFAALGDMPAKLKEALQPIGRTMDHAINTANQLSSEQRRVRTQRLDEMYRAFRDLMIQRVEGALDDRPMQIDDFPDELIESYRDERGRLAMLIFPKLPADGSIANAMDPRFLPHFVEDMADVDDRFTGNAPQFYLSGVLIRDSYIKAGIAALVLVFLIVMIDFHSAFEAALSLLPVAIGFAVTFAIMWMIGMQINPANIMVLPLMFGLGVDAGVHVLHRYRQAPMTDPPGLSGGTGKGITITVITTMIGFGSLMLASHRGIFSLGFVMTVGLGFTLVACWIVMPAVLTLRRARASA